MDIRSLLGTIEDFAQHFPGKPINLLDAQEHLEYVLSRAVSEEDGRNLLEAKGYEIAEPPILRGGFSNGQPTTDDAELAGDDPYVNNRRDRNGRPEYAAAYADEDKPYADNKVLLEEYARTGDEGVFLQLIQNNMGFVHRMVGVYDRNTQHDLTYEDLLQEGIIGLMEAIRRFDVEAGTTLSTYAVHWLRVRLERAVCNAGTTVRVPERLHALIRLIKQEESECVARGISADPQVICERLAISRDEYDWAKRVDAHLIRIPSIDQPVGNDGEATLADFVSGTFQKSTGGAPLHHCDPEVLVITEEMGDELHNLLYEHLTSQERRVIRLRFGFDDGEPKSLRQVGDLFGVSHEWIRRIEAEALRKLRDLLKGKEVGFGMPEPFV